MRSLIPLSLLLTIFDSPVHGYVFPFHVRFNNNNPTSSLTRRTPVPISNIGNAQYVSNITVAGQSLPVLLDTGSSDLWVNFQGTIPTANMKDTGTAITLSYAVGKAGGDIQTAAVSIGNLTVQDQAFLWVNDTSTFTSDIHSQGYDGLLGLGPNQSSVIRKKVDNDSANTILQRIFASNTTTANYITLLLNRKSDPAENFTGQFTVSEVAPGFENITSMPKLDVDTVNRLLKSDQHWQALTDKNMGIIGPDSNPIQIDSIVPFAPSGEYVAVIDSGYTFSQVPRDVSDAIYGRVRGAAYDSKNEWWLVPCGQYLNVSFNFGGRNYPIHPLDLVDNNFGIVDSTGKTVCIGAFQPITSAFSVLGHYDMILGMSFLRSAYTLLDFGDWTDSGSQDHPYIQLASIVDTAAARKDFIQVRLGGNDTTSAAQWSLLPVDQMQHSPVSAEEKKKMYQEMILSRWPYIFVGCLVFVLIVIGLLVWKCCCRRKAQKAKKAALEDDAMGGFGGAKKAKKGGFFSGKAKTESYVPLEAQNRSVADLSAPYTPNTPQPPRSSYASQAPPTPAHYSQNYDQNYSTNSLASYPEQYPGYQPQHGDYAFGNHNQAYQGQHQV